MNGYGNPCRETAIGGGHYAVYERHRFLTCVHERSRAHVDVTSLASKAFIGAKVDLVQARMWLASNSIHGFPLR